MSKGLEALKEIVDYAINEFTDNEKKYQKDLETIEKELKALVIIFNLFDFDIALRYPSNQPILKITNRRTEEYWEIPILQDYDLLKEVLL